MQQTPVRILLAFRPQVPAAVLLGSAISTVVFSATPFLLPAIAAEQDINVGLVGLISTAQLGGFVLAAWGAGRWLRPRRRVLVIAAILGVLVNVVSALTPLFALLLVARFLSGIAIGLIDWIAWSEVFGDSDRTGDVAVIGPLVGTLSAPLLASLIDARGSTWLFSLLAVLHLVPVLFLRSTRLDAARRPRQERHRPTRGAAVVLVCLCGLTLGGSAVFVYAAAIGLETIGMSALAVSLAFSLNALMAVPSARSRHRRRLSGAWVAVTGLMGVLVTTVGLPLVFIVAMGCWGFAFWMAVPGAFALLASRSRYPDERAGDAQAAMAFGRVLGPALGGLLYVNAPLVALGLVGGGIVVVAGALMLWVEHRIDPIPSVQQIRSRRAVTP
ncbi:MAG: MFS transporter [Ilumatobacter sp.]|nr:MAG: MFS transporter [Ilumatobacter sp.]